MEISKEDYRSQNVRLEINEAYNECEDTTQENKKRKREDNNENADEEEQQGVRVQVTAIFEDEHTEPYIKETRDGGKQMIFPAIPKPKIWFKRRRGKLGIGIGASETGQVSNYTDISNGIIGPQMYYRNVKEELDKEIFVDNTTKSTIHGDYCEPKLIKNYAFNMDCNVEKPKTPMHHPDFPDYFTCQPDGICEKNGLTWNLEIKAPHVIKPEIPKQYMCQMQDQMWITGKSFCDYYAVVMDYETKTIIKEECLIRVYRSEPFIAWMQPRLLFMINCLLYFKHWKQEHDSIEDPILREKHERFLLNKEAKYDLQWEKYAKEKPPKVNTKDMRGGLYQWQWDLLRAEPFVLEPV